MISRFSKSIILFLTVLQFFSPLVHAHTGDNKFKLGLHIPGLENYVLDKDTLVSQNVNSNWADEGLAVMVDAGIKLNQDRLVYEAVQTAILLPCQKLRLVALPANNQSFSPHPTPLALNNPLDSILAPRAPPAQ